MMITMGLKTSLFMLMFWGLGVGVCSPVPTVDPCSNDSGCDAHPDAQCRADFSEIGVPGYFVYGTSRQVDCSLPPCPEQDCTTVRCLEMNKCVNDSECPNDAFCCTGCCGGMCVTNDTPTPPAIPCPYCNPCEGTTCPAFRGFLNNHVECKSNRVGGGCQCVADYYLSGTHRKVNCQMEQCPNSRCDIAGPCLYHQDLCVNNDECMEGSVCCSSCCGAFCTPAPAAPPPTTPQPDVEPCPNERCELAGACLTFGDSCDSNAGCPEGQTCCTSCCGTVCRPSIAPVPVPVQPCPNQRCELAGACLSNHDRCGADPDCPEGQTCCMSCCGTMCRPEIAPVSVQTTPTPQPDVEPCPNERCELAGACFTYGDSCYSNADCPEDRRCCRSCCGTTCLPASAFLPTTPAPPTPPLPEVEACPNLNCDVTSACKSNRNWCFNDDECTEGKTCCKDCCGNNCYSISDAATAVENSSQTD